MEQTKGSDSKCQHGPGYPTPLDAMQNGPRETFLYLTVVKHNTEGGEGKPDFLSVVDVDPKSPTYCKELSRLVLPYAADELHKLGWNSCSSCFDDPTKSRRFIIAPAFYSDRIYIFDTVPDPKYPRLHKIIDPEEVRWKTGLSTFHDIHCLPSGQVMLSAMGVARQDDLKGGFILLNPDTWEVIGRWDKGNIHPPFGSDFWYQPRHNVMLSSEAGAPQAFLRGLHMEDIQKGLYGHHIDVWDWTTHKVIDRLDLGANNLGVFTVRFLHNPDKAHAYAPVAFSSGVFHIYKDESNKWHADQVIKIPVKKVKGWKFGTDMPAIMGHIVISLDDKYMYMPNYTHGEVRQYDITDPFNPKLVGQVFVAGWVSNDRDIEIIEDEELDCPPEPLYLKGRRVEGAPHYIQLSLDGKRLYVSFCMLSIWNKRHLPESTKTGGHIVQIDVDTEKGGLTVNKDFAVYFDDPYGPCIPQYMMIPGGDCVSDIWL